MTDLPSGIVTFLFTDIEGSTPLWERDPDAMRQSLELHNAILSAAINSHNGVTFKFVGDAFQAAFPYPIQALNAAIEIQRRLSAAEWGATGALRVRIGLHTGPAEVQGSEYVSHTLNRVSRVMSAAHGRQILLTSAVAELLGGRMPDGSSLRDMGQHHLKGMTQPEHIFQVVAPDLQSDFPPLLVFDISPNNLPLALTSFIGREKELATVDHLLQDARLVTLTGSGGVGKTRLAIEVGRRAIPHYSDGVWMVELAPLTDPQLVPQALAAVLGIQEVQDRPLMEVLKDHLRSKKSLLILDNCEHLIDVCTQTTDTLLHACPKLTVLVSSREALGLAGEQPFPVPNLSLPGDENGSLENVMQTEALRLFIERSQTAMPGFHLTAENLASAVQVCRRLDGIPLAIELAAARVKTLRVEQIAQRLDDRFRLLTGGSRTALPRQQTLRATIDWSYGLLSQVERRLLERLSVFSGGCSLEAAEAICAGEDIDQFEILDLLTSLVNRSMVAVEREQGMEPRFRLLETIRQYAREKLYESGQIATFRDAHLEYFLEWAEMADPKTRGPEQAYWLEQIDEEYGNLLAALEWASETYPRAGLRLASALGIFWWIRNKDQEGIRWLTSFLQHPENQTRDIHRGYALGRLAFIRLFAIDPSSPQELAQESLSISREISDQTGEAFARYVLGWICYQRKEDYVTARSFFLESLAIYEASSDQWGIGRIFLNLGNMAGYQGQTRDRRNYLERSLAACRQAGDLRGIAIALDNLATDMVEVDCNLKEGRKMVEESIQIYKDLKGYGTIDNALLVYGQILACQGEYPHARDVFQELVDIDRQRGDIQLNSSINLWYLDRLEGKHEQAAALHEERLAQLKAIGLDHIEKPWYLTVLLTELGYVLTNLGNFSRAKNILEEAFTVAKVPLDRALIFQGLGRVAVAQKDGESASPSIHQSLQILHSSNYRIYSLSALEDFAGALHLLSQDTKAARILGKTAAVRQHIGAPIPPGDKLGYERLLVDLQTQLGEAEFTGAWEEGQKVTLDKAIAYALE